MSSTSVFSKVIGCHVEKNSSVGTWLKAFQEGLKSRVYRISEQEQHNIDSLLLCNIKKQWKTCILNECNMLYEIFTVNNCCSQFIFVELKWEIMKWSSWRFKCHLLWERVLEIFAILHRICRAIACKTTSGDDIPVVNMLSDSGDGMPARNCNQNAEKWKFCQSFLKSRSKSLPSPPPLLLLPFEFLSRTFVIQISQTNLMK